MLQKRCEAVQVNKYVPDFRCRLDDGHGNSHLDPLTKRAWKFPDKKLPYGMAHAKRQPQSSHKAYPFGQFSLHCRVCCKWPWNAIHYSNPNNHCQGEQAVSGYKNPTCPKCGTRWDLTGGFVPIEREQELVLHGPN